MGSSVVGSASFSDSRDIASQIEVADAATGGNVAAVGFVECIQSRQGDQVLIQFYVLNIDTTGLTPGNDLYIRGFDYSPLTTGAHGKVILRACTFSGVPAMHMGGGQKYMRVQDNVSGDTVNNYIPVSALISGSADIIGTLSFVCDHADIK